MSSAQSFTTQVTGAATAHYEVANFFSRKESNSRKEVTLMTYSKPEVRLLDSALGAIQGTPKPSAQVLDSASQSKLTNAAYEADE